MVNYAIQTDGYVTVYATVYGQIGRSPKERGKTLPDQAQTKTTPMHGAERGKADGQLPKALFWEQR